MKNWTAKEANLTDRRNKLCMKGYTREEVLLTHDAEQQRNNRRYNGLMKNRKLTTASFK